MKHHEQKDTDWQYLSQAKINRSSILDMVFCGQLKSDEIKNKGKEGERI
jgi:hypothetical protein